MSENCPYCASVKEFESLGMHWVMASDCPGPVLSGEPKDILLGLVLSGASVTKGEKESRFRVSLSTKSEEFAEWLRSKLGVLAKDVAKRERVKDTQLAVERGYDGTIYELETRNCDAISELKDYNFQEINPLAARVLFARKGVVNAGWSGYLQIQVGRSPLSKNEMGEVLNRSSGLDMNWSNQKQAIRSDSETNVKQFLRWIGGPIPGMEWRWDPAKRAPKMME